MSRVVYVGGPQDAFTGRSKLPELPTLTVPVPLRGWLTLTFPRDGVERLSLARDWVEATARACRLAGLGRLGRSYLTAVVRPAVLARRGYPGVHAAEDVRLSLQHAVEGLVEARVLFSPNEAQGQEIRMGAPTGPAGEQGYLQLWLTEVDGG